ncbi:hypothetical protein RhiJN_01775 [Ceratobasidium sp. AG-Ba]|nr:hypothetical protein RhiJN_01775 [Ceratobasidium sp. AG-Ba]QRW02710.1 hypothetical protein RhiLY_01709 [Ceratobasidium sp. AG-Ba]
MACLDAPITLPRDASPESLADLFVQFTLGAPATDDSTRHRKLAKPHSKASPRPQGPTKRRSPPNAAATQPNSRAAPTAQPIGGLPPTVPFTFSSSKTIDFSHPIPYPKSRPVDPTFTPAPSAFPKAIQSLPPDILTPVIRLAESDVLKSLSLVNRALHFAIAPILYRSLILNSLASMFFTPDPKRPGWTPPDGEWSADLIKTLYSLERLLHFAIKRPGNTPISNVILSHSNNPMFFPSLQSLSFGSSHQFSQLALTRSIRSCGFTFQIKEPGDYTHLGTLLKTVTSSGELLRELQLVINIPMDEDRSHVLRTIGDCAPGVRKLSVRFQMKGERASRYNHPTTLIRALPPLANLTSLELFDTVQFEGDLHGQIFAAVSLAKKCPNIRYVNFDGTLWKRSPPAPPSPPRSPSPSSSGPPKKSQFPRLDWTPYPASVRGSNWWGDQSYLLEAKSQQQATSLLRLWVLEYWNLQDMWEVEPRAVVWDGSDNGSA